MTLLNLLTIICFALPLGSAIEMGKEAGVVGIVIGIGTGLVAGGLAFYALKMTVYSDAFIGRVQSQPQFVQRLIETAAVVWIVFLLVFAGFIANYSMAFIVQKIVA